MTLQKLKNKKWAKNQKILNKKWWTLITDGKIQFLRKIKKIIGKMAQMLRITQ